MSVWPSVTCHCSFSVAGITVEKWGGLSTYPSTHNPPVHQSHQINKHLQPPLHPPWFHQPANQLLWSPVAQTVSAPSPCHRLKRLVFLAFGFFFVCFFELFSRSSPRPPTNTPPGKWSHHSQHGSDQPLVTFPPTRTPFFIYATKEVPPASSKKVTVGLILVVYSVLHLRWGSNQVQNLCVGQFYY